LLVLRWFAALGSLRVDALGSETSKAMEVQFRSDQFTSDPEALDFFTVATAQPGGGDDAVRQAPAAWEDRERRRIEFRSSLMNARASVTPVEAREIMQQSTQRTAEIRERRPAHMVAELASAH
jgi:hypothetical protein